jgi:hypothetical protein
LQQQTNVYFVSTKFQVCQQLLSIVTLHATTMCHAHRDEPCNVPLCDQLRRSGVGFLDPRHVERHVERHAGPAQHC